MECLAWDNGDASTTLVGDAAHAITMRRCSLICFAVGSCIIASVSNKSVNPLDHGEAANHGLLDALNLSNALAKVYSGTSSQKEAIEAVLPSRQACWRRMSGGASTRIVLLSGRAIVAWE
jgi:hypothetical protein